MVGSPVQGPTVEEVAELTLHPAFNHCTILVGQGQVAKDLNCQAEEGRFPEAAGNHRVSVLERYMGRHQGWVSGEVFGVYWRQERRGPKPIGSCYYKPDLGQDGEGWGGKDLQDIVEAE